MGQCSFLKYISLNSFIYKQGFFRAKLTLLIMLENVINTSVLRNGRKTLLLGTPDGVLLPLENPLLY